MCFSKESSITAYILSFLVSVFLYFTGNNFDKHIAFFSIVFIQIQLAEYFMWKDQNCSKMNHYASIYANIVLILQPISILFGAYLFETLTIPKKYIISILLILMIPFFTILIKNIKNKRKLCSKKQKSGYLEWDFIGGGIDKWPVSFTLFYMIFMLIPWLFLKDQMKGILSFFIIITSFLVSRIDSNDINMKFKQWESKWCFLCIIYPIIFVCLSIFKHD